MYYYLEKVYIFNELLHNKSISAFQLEMLDKVGFTKCSMFRHNVYLNKFSTFTARPKMTPGPVCDVNYM